MKTLSQYIGKSVSPLLTRKLIKTGLYVNLPSQQTDLPADTPVINITDWSFFTDVLLGYDLGFAESYFMGKWDTSNLAALFTRINTNSGKGDSPKVGNMAPFKLWGRLIQSIRSSNNLYWASKNIRDHYDVSNTWFSSFLDPSMTYSSGLFEKDTENLLDAQVRKLDTILDRAAVKKGDHILDIGCGWGSLITRATSEIGCISKGITLSENQYAHCNKLIEQRGLKNDVAVQLVDYRNINGLFDHIFAVEMLEAVGHKGLEEFFSNCERLLKPGGTLQLQVIVVPDHRYASYRKNCDFIQKYVFPGGVLPSKTAINNAASRNGLRFKETHSIGRHYVNTLRKWASNFESQLDNLRDIGFSERELRRFKYYFNYCEVAFSSGHIDNLQISLEKGKPDVVRENHRPEIIT